MQHLVYVLMSYRQARLEATQLQLLWRTAEGAILSVL